jgi:hypothetical protein
MSRYVLTGLSRLTVRVAILLLERGAALTVTEHSDHDLLAVMPADVTLMARSDEQTRRRFTLGDLELVALWCEPKRETPSPDRSTYSVKPSYLSKSKPSSPPSLLP